MHDYLTASTLRDMVHGLLWLNDRHIEHVDALNRECARTYKAWNDLQRLRLADQQSIRDLEHAARVDDRIQQLRHERLRKRTGAWTETSARKPVIGISYSDDPLDYEIADYRKRVNYSDECGKLRKHVKELEHLKEENTKVCNRMALENKLVRARNRALEDKIEQLRNRDDELCEYNVEMHNRLRVAAREAKKPDKTEDVVTTEQLMKDNKALLDRVHVLEEDKKFIERRRGADNKVLLERVCVLKEKNKRQEDIYEKRIRQLRNQAKQGQKQVPTKWTPIGDHVRALEDRISELEEMMSGKNE